MTIRIGFILTILLTSVGLFAQEQLEVIVEFASAKTVTAAKEDLLASAKKSGNAQTVAPVWCDLRCAGERHIAVVKSSKSIEQWEATPGILRVSISRPLAPRTRTPNDPTFPEQWDMEQIEAPAAWEYTTGGTSFSGRKITIGVIENNGFQLDHPDLQGAIFVNQAEIPNDNIDNDNNGFIDDVSGWNYTDSQNEFERHNHGTKVLGNLGARGDNGIQAVGVNWETTMVPLQVASFGQWILALDYLTALRRRYNETGGTEGSYVVVANMSLGAIGSGTCDPDLNEAFDRAGEEGILCIGATSNDLGNLDENPDPSSDCTSDFLIIVTASTRQDEIFRSSGYSTTDVDIAAPGEDYQTLDYIVSGNPNSNFQGTSGATPHVAGAIALAYSIDCPTLDEISLIDPAGAALIVKDAILTTGDDAVGNAALTTSGKRLNVRRAIEGLLLEDCLIGDMIVQLEGDQTPPNTLTDDAGDLSLVRTLSEDWNIHLYNSAGGAILDHVAQLEAMSTVRAAEPNIRLVLRGRQPNDPGFQTQTSLQDMQASDGWETVYGAAGTPPPSRVVTAIFDQNFDLSSPDLDNKVYSNTQELASNGIDDDGNGYIDDANGFNLTARSSDFSIGNHGFAVAAIAAANANDGFGIAGIDWSGSVLPLEGNTLAQWIEGAAYIAPLRSQYNESQGAGGALVISYVTPQGGQLLREGGTLIMNVLDELDVLGVLTIGAAVNDDTDVSSDFPTSVNHEGLLNTAFAFAGEIDTDLRSFDESNMPLYLPSDNTAYALTSNDTLRLSGSSAASALAAGSLSLLYQTPCADFEAQAFRAPNSTSARLKRALSSSSNSVSGYQNSIVQLNLAAQQVASTCLQGGDCGILSLYPNPIPAEGLFTFEMVSGNQTNSCPVSIYDPLGRVIFRQNLDLANGYREVELPVSILGNGLYFLSTGEGDAAQTRSLIRAQ